MRRIIFVALLISILGVAVPQLNVQPVQGQRVVTSTATVELPPLQLTVRNISDKQPLTPPIVIVHDRDTVLIPSSAERIEGLEEMAEAGMQQPLMDAIRDRAGVESVMRFGGVINPGDSVTIQNIPAGPGDYVSVIGKLACTNDAIAISTAVVSEDGTLPSVAGSRVLDAGTEDNDETEDTVPCLGGEGVSRLERADGEGLILPHPGIIGNEDLGKTYGWDGGMIQIILGRRGASVPRQNKVGITIQNLTKAQPVTPPILVVHDTNVDLFTFRRPKELAGIAELSESGDQERLATTLRTKPGVVAVYKLETGGPIAPDESFTVDIDAVAGTSISVLGMLACTNDAYFLATVPVSATLTRNTANSGIATIYDSGSETNDETRDTVLCLGGAVAGVSDGYAENMRAEHKGITGNADLSRSTHGWNDDSTVRVFIHETGRATVVTPVPPTATPPPSPTPEPTPEIPETGGAVPSSNWLGLLVVIGLLTSLAGIGMIYRHHVSGSRS